MSPPLPCGETTFRELFKGGWWRGRKRWRGLPFVYSFLSMLGTKTKHKRRLAWRRERVCSLVMGEGGGGHHNVHKKRQGMPCHTVLTFKGNTWRTFGCGLCDNWEWDCWLGLRWGSTWRGLFVRLSSWLVLTLDAVVGELLVRHVVGRTRCSW